MSHLNRRSFRHNISLPAKAGSIEPRKGLALNWSERQLPVARTLACALLCALALVLTHAAQPESAQAAMATKGVVTGTLYFNKLETAVISYAGPEVVAYCVARAPGWSKAVCAVAAAWAVQAWRADRKGMCLKVKFLLRNKVIHWPDIYRRGYCR